MRNAGNIAARLAEERLVTTRQDVQPRDRASLQETKSISRDAPVRRLRRQEPRAERLRRAAASCFTESGPSIKKARGRPTSAGRVLR